MLTKSESQLRRAKPKRITRQSSPIVFPWQKTPHIHRRSIVFLGHLLVSFFFIVRRITLFKKRRKKKQKNFGFIWRQSMPKMAPRGCEAPLTPKINNYSISSLHGYFCRRTKYSGDIYGFAFWQRQSRRRQALMLSEPTAVEK